jgi:hypothetical protein
MTPGQSGLATITGERLLAIGDLWERSGRTLSVCFGGVSMLPSIAPAEDLLLIADTRVTPGEVIAYVYRDQIAVHRLLAVSRDGRFLLTCGDAHRIPDLPVAATSVIGRVVRANGSAIPPPRTHPLARAVRLLFRRSIPLAARLIVWGTAVERRLAAVLR